MERTDYLKTTGFGFWDGRANRRHTDAAPPMMARTPRTHGSRQDTNDTAIWRAGKKRPRHGTKKRWCDGVKADLQAIGVRDDWLSISQNRSMWNKTCTKGVEQQRKVVSECVANRREAGSNHQCPCGRVFRRKGDLTRHHCFCETERCT